MRLMANIASRGADAKVALRKIASEENISLKYLEQVARSMVEAGLLSSVRGYGGGYTLTRPASEIKAGDILRAAEGTTTPVACAGLAEDCPRQSICTTISFWAGLDHVIEEYVDSKTLADFSEISDCLVMEQAQ